MTTQSYKFALCKMWLLDSDIAQLQAISSSKLCVMALLSPLLRQVPGLTMYVHGQLVL